MTCIVAISNGPSLWLGADSRVSDDSDHHQISAVPKAWRSGSFLIGAAGNGGWFSVLRQVSWPSVPTTAWLLCGLPVALRQAGDRLGLSFPAADEDAHDGAALVCCAIAGVCRVFYMDSTMDVDEYSPQTAIGSGGGKAARAALYLARGRPAARVRQVLEAVSHVATDCGPPFVTLRLDAR